MNNWSNSDLLIIKRALRKYDKILESEINVYNRLIRFEENKNNKIMKLSNSRNLSEKKKLEIIIKKVNSLKAGESQ